MIQAVDFAISRIWSINSRYVIGLFSIIVDSGILLFSDSKVIIPEKADWKDSSFFSCGLSDKYRDIFSLAVNSSRPPFRFSYGSFKKYSAISIANIALNSLRSLSFVKSIIV